MVIGAIAGVGAANADPQHAFVAGHAAGAAAVAPIRIYLFFGAILISVIGSAKGFLPGTKSRS